MDPRPARRRRPGQLAGRSADESDAAPLREQYGLACTRPASFAVEHRNGWADTDDTPPQGTHDGWDEKRAEQIVLARPSPRDGRVLTVRGGQAAFRSGPAGWWQPALYAVDDEVLDDVQ